MLEAIPARAFFRFEFPLHYWQRGPRIDGNLHKWPSEPLLPTLCEIDGQAAFADVYGAWNENGLYFAFDVPGRRGLPSCDVAQWWKKDGLRLCIDTRDARDVKRGTRYCHFFYILPVGGGRDKRGPIIGHHRMSRAKEHPLNADTSRIEIASAVDARGYQVELAIPGDALTGFDPAEHPRIGLFYKVKDTQLGSQTLSATDELGWNVDPSQWATAVLSR